MTISKKHLGYVFTFLLIVLSGSVVFSWNRFYLLAALVVSLVIYFSMTQKIDKELFYVVGALIVVTFFQFLQFSFFSFWTTSGTLIRFLLPYFAIKIIGAHFPKYFVRILYVFTLISFSFYIPTILIPGFFNAISRIPEFIGTSDFGQGINFLIYTAEPSQRLNFYRNAGPFHEPGMFSIYLILAIIFNTMITRRIAEKKNYVFFLAVFSTFSTAGYIGLSLVFIFYFLLRRRLKHHLFFVPLVIVVSLWAFFNLEFMSEKINREIEAVESGAVYAGRIGSAVNDIEDITKYPLFGRGRNVQTRFDNYYEGERHAELLFHRTNGLTDFVVRYGLFFSVLFFGYILKSLLFISRSNNYPPVFAVYSLIIIMIIGMSQTVFQHLFFIALMYFSVNQKNQKNQLADYNGHSK